MRVGTQGLFRPYLKTFVAPLLSTRLTAPGLNHADIPEESKHPVILPRKSHVTTLIIRHTHEQLGHAGRGHVLAKLRERYWIIKANSAVRQLISSCVICRRIKSTPQDQKMADLPEDRLTPAPPFTYVGVDYFGPYVTKEGRKERKRYGALFTCLVSRAVHIEVAHSLDTDSFLHALRRLITRRGQVREIRSDNGTNFVGARRELREAINEIDQREIREKNFTSKTSTEKSIPLLQFIWAESGKDKYGQHVEFLILYYVNTEVV